MEPEPYCDTPPSADPLMPGLTTAVAEGPRADCVLCGEPSEYPADAPGAPQCPRCAWQQAQRGACSG